MNASQSGVEWSNRHTINLSRIEAGQVEEVKSLLSDLSTTLQGKIQKSGIAPGKQSKLETLLKSAKEAIGETYEGIAKQQELALTDVAKLESQAVGKLLNSQIGADVYGAVLTESQWSALAKKTLVQGHSSRDWWAAQDQGIAFKFVAEMQQGYALGEDVDTLARRVRGTKAAGYSDGLIEGLSKREATALVRSSVQTISNQARLASFEQNPELIKGVQWVATFDTRTTPICMALNGLTWRLPDYKPVGHAKEFPGATAHWGCRSTQIAVLRSWEDMIGKPIKALDDQTLEQRLKKRLAAKGMDAKQVAAATARSQASMDGQVAIMPGHEAWLKGLADHEAYAILGAGRYQLWKDGKIKISDLTDQKNRPLTIAQLEAAYSEGTFPPETEGVEYIPGKPLPGFTAAPPDESAALAEITDTLANPKGKTLKAAALKKLQASEPELTPSAMLAKAEGIAAEKQAAASKASALSQAKKKILDGKPPTPAQQAVIDALEGDELVNWNDSVGATKALAKNTAELDQANQAITEWASGDDPLKKEAMKIATKQLEKGLQDGSKTAIDVAEAAVYQHQNLAYSKLITDIGAGYEGSTQLKQKAFSQLTGYKGSFKAGELDDWISDNLAIKEIPDLQSKVTSIAAEKQATASKASKLSTAKKKILAGKQPSPSEQATIDSLDQAEKQNWTESVQQAQALKKNNNPGFNVTPEPIKLDSKKGLKALEKMKPILGSEYEDFLDYLDDDEIQSYKVNGIKLNPYNENWNIGEDFSVLSDVEKEKTPNQLMKVKLADLTSAQTYVDGKVVEAYLKSGELNSKNPAHLGKPPLIIKVNGEYQIHDGNHRANAWMLAGETEIDALVYDLDAAKAKTAPVTSIPPVKKTQTITQPDTKAKNQDLYVPALNDLEKIKDLPGSTQPYLAADLTTGKQWVVKSSVGMEPEHLKSESLADSIYRAAGVPVPGSAIGGTAANPIKVAEFIDGGKTLSEFNRTASAAAKAKVTKQLQENFVMDALLANWDVAGASNDNILVTADGTAVRIDNGGALFFRAQGGAKSFDPEVGELKTLRDSNLNPTATAIFGGIKQAEIDRQITVVLSKREAILEAAKSDRKVQQALAKRMDWLESQLPKTSKPPTAEAVAASRQIWETIPDDIDKQAKQQRINGIALPVGASHVEDMQALTWEEKLGASKTTVVHLKVTDQGNAAIQAAIAPKLAGATTTAAGFTDDIGAKFEAMAKTINTHLADKKYNQATVANFEASVAQMEAKAKTLQAVKNKTAVQKAEADMIAHYLGKADALKNAAKKGITPPWVDKFPKTVAHYQDDADVANQAAKDDFQVTVSKKYQQRITSITNGNATVQASMQEFDVDAGAYRITMPDGTEIQYVPRTGRNATMSATVEGIALEGTVQVRLPASLDKNSVAEALERLKAIGVDTEAASADYREAVWLAKTVRIHNNHTDVAWKKIEKIDDLQTRIKESRKFIEKKYKVKVPTRGEAGYTADGEANSFGGGVKHFYRADLTREEIETQMKGHTLHHSTSRSIPDVVKAFLNTGGEATTTTNRIRKGIDVDSTGGMSARTDIMTGGADFFFTRIREDSKVKQQSGIFFKIRNLARADAVTYTSDNYGATGLLKTRKSKVADYKSIAQAENSDETVLKNGLNFLDEVERIQVMQESTRQEVIQAFKQAGYTHLPDGRKIEDIILATI